MSSLILSHAYLPNEITDLVHPFEGEHDFVGFVLDLLHNIIESFHRAHCLILHLPITLGAPIQLIQIGFEVPFVVQDILAEIEIVSFRGVQPLLEGPCHFGNYQLEH